MDFVWESGEEYGESVGTGVKVPDSHTISLPGFSSQHFFKSVMYQTLYNFLVFRSEFPH